MGALAAAPAQACTPIVTLIYSFGGPAPLMTATGGAMLVLLPMVIALKCYLYARQVRYGRRRAVVHMFVANIYSTFLGLFYVILLANPVFALFAVFIVPLLVYPSARRCFTVDAAGRRRERQLVPFIGALMILLLFSVFLHLGLSEVSDVTTREDAALYFALKIAALFASFSAAIGITVFIEAGTILRWMKKDPEAGQHGVFRAAAYATLLALLIAAGIGAIAAIPIRMQNRNFLMPGVVLDLLFPG